MNPVLYTMDGCFNCHKAKQHLIKHKISFIEKNLFTDENAALEVKKLIGEVITPIFVDGDLILKGNDILKIENKENPNE